MFTHFNCTLFFVISFPCSLLDSRVDKSLCFTRDLCFIYLFFFIPSTQFWAKINLKSEEMASTNHISVEGRAREGRKAETS